MGIEALNNPRAQKSLDRVVSGMLEVANEAKMGSLTIAYYYYSMEHRNPWASLY
jgi:hypothetical protein